MLEHFLSGITDANTRQWLELKAIKTVPEAINKLIHYESVVTTPEAEMSRKPREVVAAVEEVLGVENLDPEDQMIAVVNGGQSGNSYPQRYSGQQNSGQNTKQGYRSTPPRPYYQGANQGPRPAYQGQQSTPGNAQGAPPSPQGREPLPNKGIIQMFRAHERQMGDQNQTMNGQGEKIDLIVRALQELVQENRRTEPSDQKGEKNLVPPGEKKPWDKTNPPERKCWRCQQPGHLFRDCPVEASVIAALETGLERTLEPADIGDQLAEN